MIKQKKLVNKLVELFLHLGDSQKQIDWLATRLKKDLWKKEGKKAPEPEECWRTIEEIFKKHLPIFMFSKGICNYEDFRKRKGIEELSFTGESGVIEDVFHPADVMFPLFETESLFVYAVQSEHLFIMVYNKDIKRVTFQSFRKFFIENSTVQLKGQKSKKATLFALEQSVKNLMASARVRMLVTAKILIKDLEKLH